MDKFFKNKALGYYLACASALVSLIYIIIFYLTVNGGAMPNSAFSKGFQTIGVFMIAGLCVQIGFLVVPTLGILELAALVLYGFSFYKELICCPTALIVLFGQVAYEGGSAGLHLTYIASYLVIFGLAIAGAFVGYFKDDEESAEDLKIKDNGSVVVANVAKLGGVALVLIVAILASSIAANSIMKSLSGKVDPQEQQQEGEEEKKSPLTEEIKAAAQEYAYSFDPASIHFEKEDLSDEEGKFDFSSESGISSLPTNGKRDDYELVYKFEGSYAEGWQGDYSKTYAYLYLWEDGKFAGTSGSTQFRGYWYDNGDASTLVMVTSNNSDGEIIAYSQTGFYSWIVDLNSSVNGGRRIKANGYLYYPEVALFIDTNDANLEAITVGSVVDTSGWTAQRVLKNLKYSSCYEDNSNKVAWKVNGSAISNGTVNITEAGEYEITATWGTLVASVKFTVA